MDELPPASAAAAAPPAPRWRRTRLLVTGVALVGAVGVPVALALTGGGSPGQAARRGPTTTVRPGPSATTVPSPTRGGPAEAHVLQALGTTTSAGSFDFSYTLSETVASGTPGTTVTGSGIIDTGPMAMAASAAISSSLDVGVRVDTTDVWEVGSGDNQVQPADDTGDDGQPLSGFAGVVEGTLGQDEGAVAMVGMANPTGYLDLDQAGVTGADAVGTGSVDGVPVTEYRVGVDLAQLAGSPAVTAEEATTIDAALGRLQADGYTGTVVTVSVDGAGYIRRAVSVASFASGRTVTLDATFSDFGCAGTVGMPGSSGTPAPAGCTSPDQPGSAGAAATTTTTTTAVQPSVLPTVVPTTSGVPSTTAAPPSTTSTTTATTTSTTTTSPTG